MDFSLFFSLSVELIGGFFALLVITKFLGKTQINQITPFNFISALVLGELLGNAIYSQEIGLMYVIYSIALWSFLIYSIEVLTQKYRRLRVFFEDKPVVLIKNGQVDFVELKRSKLDLDEMQVLLRQRDVFSVREVEYAILEPNGSLSVLKKYKYSTPENADMNKEDKPVFLPVDIVMDGEIIWENMRQCGFNNEWLQEQLEKKGVERLQDVFYAEWEPGEGLHVSLRNKKKLHEFS